jgi:hypothetical protein
MDEDGAFFSYSVHLLPIPYLTMDLEKEMLSEARA